jgi:hypothetical protein
MQIPLPQDQNMQEFKAIAPRFNSLLHTINAGASVDTCEPHCGLGDTGRSPQQNVAATRSQKIDIFYKQILTTGPIEMWWIQ